MNSNRKTATIVGVLFIIATAAALISFVLFGPMLEDPKDSDYFSNVSENENQILIALFLQIIMAIAIGGIAVLMFPILRRDSETLAIGYLCARVSEAVIVIFAIIFSLSLLGLSKEYDPGTSDLKNFQTLGIILQEASDWTHLFSGVIVFSISALIFNYLLYRTEIVPRFLSVWGFVGAALLLAAGVLQMFGLDPLSIIAILLTAPIGLNEMVLAIWLIVKGFNLSENDLKNY